MLPGAETPSYDDLKWPSLGTHFTGQGWRHATALDLAFKASGRGLLRSEEPIVTLRVIVRGSGWVSGVSRGGQRGICRYQQLDFTALAS